MPDPTDDNNTVFCQTCGGWTHQRGSCARNPSHETSPYPVMKLRREGPLSADEFDRTSYESKNKHSIAKFELVAHAKGTKSTFGHTKSVYYLTHVHNPEDILNKWVSVNKDVLKGRGLDTENVSRALSKDVFKKAWKQLCEKKEFEVLEKSNHADRGGDHYEYKECPYCNKTVKSLPGHLPCPAQ